MNRLIRHSVFLQVVCDHVQTWLEGRQSDLKSGHVSQVAPRHHSFHSPCARFRPLPGETAREFGSAVLSPYVCSTPLLDEAPGEIGIEVEHGGIASDGNTRISGVVNVCTWNKAPHGPLGIPSTFTFFFFNWWSKHDTQFQSSILLPLRRSPSFVVLHAQHRHDTQGLSCLLPLSWCDNPAKVPSPDGSIRCETISCIRHNLACIRTYSRQYISENTRGHPQGALDRAQILKRRLFRHHLHCPRSDHKSVSPSSNTVLFGMETFSQPRAQVPSLSHDASWNLPSNSEHHRCSEGQEHSSVLTSLQSLIS